MNEFPEDWRLHGQEEFLKGASLTLRTWSSPDPHWDHDHCEFCWAKIAATSIPDAVQEGYATADLKHWVCRQCFADFQEQFAWASQGLSP
ncbi:MAG: hypothetical protein JWR07_470 [Nevskia sp.]|nr:hypothetical protein [Nevskia sp.]